jgi:hypothetical protein
MTAETPGQAHEIPDTFARYVRSQFPSDYVLPENEITGRWKHMTGAAERKFWHEIDDAQGYEPGSTDISSGERDVVEILVPAGQRPKPARPADDCLIAAVLADGMHDCTLTAGHGGDHDFADEVSGAQEPNAAPGDVVHLSPRDATYVTPCCGQTPFDLTRTDRMTNDPSLVTCGGPEPKPAPEQWQLVVGATGDPVSEPLGEDEAKQQCADLNLKVGRDWYAARPVAPPEPKAAPELELGPCPFQGHHGEHLRLNTHGHWLCAITLTNMLVAADVIADPAPDVTKLRAELDEEQGYRSELTNDILLNAPESFDGDEAADVIAVRYVRHLEAEIAEHAGPKAAPLWPDGAPVRDADGEAQPAPELAAAMRESRRYLEALQIARSFLLDPASSGRRHAIAAISKALEGK